MRKFLVGLWVLFALFGGGELVQAALLDLSAIGATATANSTYSVYDASRAIDGIVSEESTWIAPDWTDNWITINLGRTYSVSQISLFSRNTSYGGSYYINYNLYAGTDGTNWGTALTSGTLYDNPDADPNSTADSDYYDDIIFSSPLSVQYIKVEIPSGTHWSHLAEIEVYEDTSGSAPVPEPSTLLLLGAGIAGLAVVRRMKQK